MTSPNATLALENGEVFLGIAVGYPAIVLGEVVFNTAATGYQEILTDPSYTNQIITFTYPHIGNTGINAEDNESPNNHARGLVIRDIPVLESHYRCQQTLRGYLWEKKICAITNVDTRRLTRILRTEGSLAGIIVPKSIKPLWDVATIVDKVKGFSGIKGKDLVLEVTTDKIWQLPPKPNSNLAQPPYNIVVYDFGVKHSILEQLLDNGCRLTIVPAQTPAAQVLAMNPDGIVLSNGPGDPEPCAYAIASIQKLLPTGVPILGICLGYQLLALACGGQTIKMKFGHHGTNHPVLDLSTKQVMITSQNHSFAVDIESLPDCLAITHTSLFDKSLQGFKHKDLPVFGFQGHPEAGPGPHEARSIFTTFSSAIKAYNNSSSSQNHVQTH